MVTRSEFLERRRALRERFPYQFRELPYYMYSIEPGWLAVFERLCRTIDSVLSDDQKQLFYWLQVKEKFGRLRTYWSRGPVHVDILPIERGQWPSTILWTRDEDSDEKTRSLEAKTEPLIQAAAHAAASMCCICAEPGRLRVDRRWWLTLCDHHAQVPPREIRRWPDEPDRPWDYEPEDVQ